MALYSVADSGKRRLYALPPVCLVVWQTPGPKCIGFKIMCKIGPEIPNPPLSVCIVMCYDACQYRCRSNVRHFAVIVDRPGISRGCDSHCRTRGGESSADGADRVPAACSAHLLRRVSAARYGDQGPADRNDRTQ